MNRYGPENFLTSYYEKLCRIFYLQPEEKEQIDQQKFANLIQQALILPKDLYERGKK